MKKNISKLFSLALALIMALALAVPAMALDVGNEDGGSISIANPTLEKAYNAYKIFDATIATGANGTIGTSYTITTGDPWYGIVSDATNVFALERVGGTTDTYYVTIKEGQEANVINTLLPKDDNDNVQLPEDAQSIGQIIPNEGAPAVEWTNVAYGYYVVTSALGSAVTVNSANPDVTIIDKNQDGPNWNPDGGKLASTDGTNYFDEISQNYNGTVYYKIAIDATNYNGEKKILSYTIYDSMTDGLTMTQSTLKVTVDGVELTKNEDYTVSYEPGTNNDKAYNMMISIDWVDDSADKNSLYAPNAKIVVTYEATVDEDAEIGDAGNNNTAWFTYADDEGDHGGDQPYTDDATVYTYALSIKKVDGTDGTTPLAGATFALALNGTNVPVTQVSDGVYKYDENSNSNEVVTPANGIVFIKGLKAGTYILTETKAPEGYNLLENSEDIVAEKASEQKVTYYYDADGVLTAVEPDEVVEVDTTETIGLTVENNRGGTLPTTGGIGTTIFYTLGGLLVVGAAVLLVTKKRMSNAEG